MKRSKKRGNFIEISLWMIKKKIKTIQTTEILPQDIMDKQPLNIFPTLTHVLLLPSSREYVNFALNDFSQITSHVFMSLHEFLEPLVLLLTCCTLSLRIHNIKIITRYWVHNKLSTQQAQYTTSTVHNKLSTQQAQYTTSSVHNKFSTQQAQYTTSSVHNKHSTQQAQYTTSPVHNKLSTQRAQ